MTTEVFTEDEIAAFSQKLEEWGTTLPEREQVLLLALVTGAAEGTADVEGFAIGPDGVSFGAKTIGAVGDGGGRTVGLRPEHFFSGTVTMVTTSALADISGTGIKHPDPQF